MVREATGKGVPWLLGSINEGWEWFAFTFNEQNQLDLTSVEIDEMLKASDDITKAAYSKMNFDKRHSWMRFTSEEVDFIEEEFKMSNSARVLDIGCGTGRHSLEFAKRGYECLGLDYSEPLIEMAKQDAKKFPKLAFRHEDCRRFSLAEKYDVVICLYDVIGSFIDAESNLNILKMIADSMTEGGKAVISVMNYEHQSTAYDSPKFSFAREPSRVLNIPASKTMQQTGNVFDPKLILVDDSTRIVYRKEVFSEGLNLPQEWIVRDKRFTLEEMIGLCAGAGLRIYRHIYAGAGKWTQPGSKRHCKEIVVFCEKATDLQVDFLGGLT